jgi:hypothetical protein
LPFRHPVCFGYSDRVRKIKFKFIFKWGLRLFLVVVLLFLIFLLSLDSILRAIVVHHIRSETGMEATIGSYHVGFGDPVITIKNLKIYNPPEFGGKPFLDIAEIHVEIDRDALAQKRQLHVNLMRFNLAELDIVRSVDGKTNIFEINNKISEHRKKMKKNENPFEELKHLFHIEFTQIDALKVSFGTAKYIDLGNTNNNREENVGIDNQVLPNVKTQDDLLGLEALIALRASDVLGVFAPTNADDKLPFKNLLF